MDSLQNYLSVASEQLKNEVLLYTVRYNRLRREERMGLITKEEARTERSRLENSLFEFLEEIPEFIKPGSAPSLVAINISDDYPEIGAVNFQKIICINNLKQISWIQRGLEVSKSICRILTSSGYGTGFLIGADRLMTNNHVISSPEMADRSYAEFNYQQNTSGKYLPTFRFRLSSNLFHTSSQNELDYTIVALEIKSAMPSLGTWGYLELNVNADPIPTEHVSIIQHPNGGLKQIILTNNQVINSKNQFLFYTTDTMPGSNDSSVFNDLWQVIAIHHAYGGIQQYLKGNQFYTNEGILMSAIKPHADQFGTTQ